jgi:hypothetical protein
MIRQRNISRLCTQPGDGIVIYKHIDSHSPNNFLGIIRRLVDEHTSGANVKDPRDQGLCDNAPPHGRLRYVIYVKKTYALCLSC